MNWFTGIAGDVLAWALSASAVAVSTFVVGWLSKLATKLSVDIKDQDRARLQEIIENGIKWAARKLNIALDGAVKDTDKAILVKAVATEYLPSTAAETVKALGGDVNDAPEMTRIVTARAADLLALPAADRALAAVATEVVIPSTIQKKVAATARKFRK